MPQVHDDLRAGRAQLAQLAECRLDGFAREIHRHAFPHEERAHPALEPRFLQPVAQHVFLEVHLDDAYVGHRQLALVPGDDARLAAAGSRMVYLEHRAVLELLREAIGAHVVTGAEDHDLFDTRAERGDEAVVDVAVTAQHPGDQPGREPLPGGERGAQHRSEKQFGVGIFEDALGGLPPLLAGAHPADGLGGLARMSAQAAPSSALPLVAVRWWWP